MGRRMSDFVYSPPETPLQIVHRDADILVLDKPAGLLSVPGRGEALADSLQSRVLAAFPEALLVHRLDLDTSGVIVFALSAAAQKNLGQQFEARQTRKVYLARLWGHLTPEKGRVDLPLIVDWPNRPRQHVNHETGKPAVTDWRVSRLAADGTTRVRLFPQTGRTHQLRVHMMALGHPILGDQLYAEGPAREFDRLMLHADSLRFRHPQTGVMQTWSARCPF